jgi:hypothetical protein
MSKNKKNLWGVHRGNPLPHVVNPITSLINTFVGLGMFDLFATRQEAEEYRKKLGHNKCNWDYQVKKYVPERKE